LRRGVELLRNEKGENFGKNERGGGVVTRQIQRGTDHTIKEGGGGMEKGSSRGAYGRGGEPFLIWAVEDDGVVGCFKREKGVKAQNRK